MGKTELWANIFIDIKMKEKRFYFEHLTFSIQSVLTPYLPLHQLLPHPPYLLNYQVHDLSLYVLSFKGSYWET